jgi:hypothetical protein
MIFYSKILGGIDTTNVWFDCLDINASSVNTYSRIAALSLTGDIKPMDISALPFKPSSYTVTPNVYSNGFGISKTGTEPAVTFSINQSDIMTVNRAADSIASLDTKINGKVPNSRAITINGTSQDLSANRTWSNVGIELPSQTGNSGKVLGTTGTVATWTTPTVTVSAPSFNNSITSGTAFQPNANSASAIIISSTLTGTLVGVYGTSIISISSTQSGTYTNIGSGMSFFLNVIAVGDNRDSGTILVPKGYWVKVTNSTTGLGGALTSTYTHWDF